MSVSAVLAPTNTGKTHRAVERMLDHASGMIGLPLRLLAREVYDRITERLGESQVALVTGEERRVPDAPRYWVCTVESMPVSRPVDFVAVDEIQLAAHRFRGHVFTDRLLTLRGRKETWFMGAETIRSMITTLVPDARISRHPRLSQLRYGGARSLRSLPPRSAVVAFSATHVYELAERLRQHRGGVAVVLGALSPRTRNAQVALYQSGEVEYMVATDAIGMGLNMDVDHIAFADLTKFDGRVSRPLEPDELAQIAGRAGRYQSDGTFGTVTPRELPPRAIRAIENHRFRPIEQVVWRNSQLDMRTVDTLIASLSRRPERSALQLVDHADDFSALVKLSTQDDIRARAGGVQAVSLLWEVCQIPDFRKLLEDSHIRLLGAIFRQLTGPQERIDTDWMRRRVDRLDDISGDIDTLMRRIAFIRTWTYISHRSAWVDSAGEWQERTRAIEDRLSDALHERLVQRFVSRQRRHGSGASPAPDARDSDHPFGKLRALITGGTEPRQRWVDDLVEAGHDRFAVTMSGLISFDGRLVGRLTRGVDLLRPHIVVQTTDDGAGAHARIRRRLTAWARDLVADLLGPLRRADAERLSPSGRGLIYQLEQSLGTVSRRQASPQLDGLTRRDRSVLRALDVRLGACIVYVPGLLSWPAVVRRAALLSARLAPGKAVEGLAEGAASLTLQDHLNDAAYMALGYPVFGPLAIRADTANRAHQALAGAARQGRPFAAPPALADWLACPPHAVPDVVTAFGYPRLDDGRFAPPRRRRKRHRRHPNRRRSS